MDKVLQYYEFKNDYYDLCKNKPWFIEIIEDCSDLEIADYVNTTRFITMSKGKADYPPRGKLSYPERIK